MKCLAKMISFVEYKVLSSALKFNKPGGEDNGEGKKNSRHVCQMN